MGKTIVLCPILIETCWCRHLAVTIEYAIGSFNRVLSNFWYLFVHLKSLKSCGQ